MKFNPQPKPEKKKKPKATGEKELFLEIWLEREHFCQNCGVPIREVRNEEGELIINPANFHHTKHKSKYPELRLVKKFIVIWCFDCHFIHHNGTQEQFNLRTKKQPGSMGKLQ